MAHACDPTSEVDIQASTEADRQQLSAKRWLRLSAPEPDEQPCGARGGGAADALWLRVRALIDAELTERQRQVLELYFLKGLDQAAVATLLGLTQQSVSEHLFGKSRDGRHVGGLVRKLRKLCERRGIAPGSKLATDAASTPDAEDG